ncbi:hypothetical protein AWU65_20380 [Paenibacillus glucanolyticus]|uniref:Uncharacterized protein n=1 Tax=Paenibacillus glucanolyticus TaxID=59843 RepID=A0A163LGL1_9BACL|nr:hypothetical protein [Paenibacillus glucanolyticus]KZS48115.1 hypothetical protein AWU65_20380 [Paenibacillus glucanolyticus]
MFYFCAFILLMVITYQGVQLTVQQRTIKDLNDRLMARNFTEYASSRAREDPPPEVKSRKPLSWYDDPDIMDGDDE